MSISTIRHDEVFKAHENNTPITIIGAGATGSRVFMALIELGLTNIRVFDFDTVEPHNLANQAFMQSHIGSPKVEGLKDLYIQKTGSQPPEEMKFYEAAVPCEYKVVGTVFLLTDTMASRREIYETSLKNNPEVTHVIETRMASTHGNVLQFSPMRSKQSKEWLETLVSDEDAEVSSCGTSISVGTTASIIANLAVWQMMHSMTNPEAGDDRLDVYLKPTMLTTGKI